jgi:hypothetical protein
MDDIKEKIKQALRHIWTNKYRLFLCLLTLCCLFGLVHYFKSADSATASISFNYSEASLGLNPNKTRFNAYEIVSDEVMERAIRRVGLQDSLTASQLAECLYLSPDGTGSANGSEYQHQLLSLHQHPQAEPGQPQAHGSFAERVRILPGDLSEQLLR